jgi:dihydrofolate reductase
MTHILGSAPPSPSEPMRVVIVAAVGRNGVIGAEGGLPWRIPEDMARFKTLTMGQTLVMGRATFESIGRPLPGRSTIVLTRDHDWSAHGVVTADTLDRALDVAAGIGADVAIVGGAEVYRSALGSADRMELTEVDSEPDGDTWFPAVDWSRWREVARDSHPGFAFVTYDRAPENGD